MEFLDYPVKNYCWGKNGSNSKIAVLYTMNNKEMDNPNRYIDFSKKYAELWLSTHKDGPIKLKRTGELLDIKLPFEFKLIEIDEPVNIRFHPDKETAQKLHLQNPEIYPDDNHKTKLLIAMSRFQMLYGFVSQSIFDSTMHEYPELYEFLEEPANVKDAFFSLMDKSGNDIADFIKKFSRKVPKTHIFTKINYYFHLNIGTIMTFFLNFIDLKPGDAVFIPPNTPYCYIEGYIAECSTSSDNVIRMALTEENVDKMLIIENLDYVVIVPRIIHGNRDSQLINFTLPDIWEKYDDFTVSKAIIQSNSAAKFHNKARNSLALVEFGDGTIDGPGIDCERIKKGSALYIPANTFYMIKARNSMMIWLIRG